MADYVSRKPEARAGIGQIFLNDVDDAIADVEWCKENGLRGGVLVGSVPTTCDWIKPLYDPYYDPLWAACEELGVAGQRPLGHRRPDLPEGPGDAARAFPGDHRSTRSGRWSYIILGGVFERFPNLKFVLTEAGCAWMPGVLEHLDFLMDGMRTATRSARCASTASSVPPRSATRVLQPELLRRRQPADTG